MKQPKRWFLLLAAAALCLAACGQQPQSAPASLPAPAVTPAETAMPAPTGSILGPELNVLGKTVILHTNDVHGRIAQGENTLGYETIAALAQQLRSQGAYVLLLDAGDATQGAPVVNLGTPAGSNAITLMGLAGYDAMALGNHDLDHGIDNALQLAETTDFAFLCANLLRRADGECPFEANRIFTLGDGTKVGVFGLITPEVATKTHPDKIRGLTILSGPELYACAQAQVDELRQKGCHLVILLSHLGTDDESAPNRSVDVLNNTTGIDLCIDGHSHTEIEGGLWVNGALLTSAGSNFANIGWVIADQPTLQAGLWKADHPLSYPDLAEPVRQMEEDLQQQLGQAFAQSEVFLNGERDPGLRNRETNLGDLCTDAMAWMARQATGQPVDGALCNGGGIRASLNPGELTRLDLKTVYPFDNTLVVIQVTGAELLEALEASSAAVPQAMGGFAQTSGIEYTIDTTVPFRADGLYPDSTFEKPAEPGSRVTITRVGGKDFDLTATYQIAVNDFMAAGGDTYYALRYAGRTAAIDTGVSPEDALLAYIETALAGKITAADYGQPAGRIHIR